MKIEIKITGGYGDKENVAIARIDKNNHRTKGSDAYTSIDLGAASNKSFTPNIYSPYNTWEGFKENVGVLEDLAKICQDFMEQYLKEKDEGEN